MTLENAVDHLKQGGDRCTRAIVLILQAHSSRGPIDEVENLVELCLTTDKHESYAFEESARIVTGVRLALNRADQKSWLSELHKARNSRIQRSRIEGQWQTPPSFFMPDVSSSYGVVLGSLQIGHDLPANRLCEHLSSVLDNPIWGHSQDLMNFRDEDEAGRFEREVKKYIRAYAGECRGVESWFGVGAAEAPPKLTAFRQSVLDLVGLYEDATELDPLSRIICDQLTISMLWTMSAENRAHVLIHGSR